MRDLEIRGAGDVLGLKQSGSISASASSFTPRCCARPCKACATSPSSSATSFPKRLACARLLAREYVSEERDRLSLYRKMSNIEDEEDIASLQDELRDRFGPLARARLQLIRILKIRLNLCTPDARHLQELRRGYGAPQARRPLRDEDVSAVHGRVSKFTTSA
jgi:transcription-repair coupling factor (superfamily II helicase)